MTAVTTSINNYYLFGNIQFNADIYFNADTGVSAIPLGELIFEETSGYPVPDSETSAILYKCLPLLDIGTVYENTQIYQGVPNTFQLGSYNYAYGENLYERRYINYQKQALRECSSCFPTYGGYPSTFDREEFIGVQFPSLQTSVDGLLLYLPNADISSVTVTLQYSLQQLQTDEGTASFVWNSLSALY